MNISIDHLSLSFGGGDLKQSPLDDVSMQLERGKFYVLAGESGSGKSLLLQSILGQLPKHPFQLSGSISFDGSLQRPSLGSILGGLPQDSQSALNPVLSIENQLMEALNASGRLDRGPVHAEMIDWLNRFGMDEPERCLKSYPDQLSGGMKQRIALILTLFIKPRWIFLDEPFSALDPLSQKTVTQELREKQLAHGMGVVLVTHDLESVRDVADVIFILYRGKLVEWGPESLVMNSPAHPYSEALVKRKLLPKGDELLGQEASTGIVHKGCNFRDRCEYSKPPCQREIDLFVDSQRNRGWRCAYPLVKGSQ